MTATKTRTALPALDLKNPGFVVMRQTEYNRTFEVFPDESAARGRAAELADRTNGPVIVFEPLAIAHPPEKVKARVLDFRVPPSFLSDGPNSDMTELPD